MLRGAVFARLKRTKAEPLQYPTLALYRSILRAHQQYLPEAHRDLGDGYVRAEFGLHRDASPEFKVQFERQWRDYLTTLHVTHKDGVMGKEMTPEEVAALNDEQKVQLLKIRENSQGPPKVE